LTYVRLTTSVTDEGPGRSIRKGTTMTQRSWSRRDFLRRTAAAGAVALGGTTALAACTSTNAGGGSVLESARSSGTIRIGIAGEEPYGFTGTDGRVTGEAPEVARAVLQGIGIRDVQAEQVDFGSLIPALNANRFDMVCAGMNITPQRCQQAAFSVPDYTALTAFLVPRGNPEGVTTFPDIAAKNLKLAVLGAAVEQGYAEAGGVPAGNISPFDDQNALLQAVTAGRVYAAALTDISLKWLAGKNPEPGFTPTQDGRPVVSAGGFVFRQGDNDLRQAFDTELQNLHGNGRWVQIASPFGFSDANLPTAGLTTEQLCSA
jgi:polar amino acid transport system substrate-binding protein